MPGSTLIDYAVVSRDMYVDNFVDENMKIHVFYPFTLTVTRA